MEILKEIGGILTIIKIYILAPGGLYGLKLLNIFYYPINHCQCCFVGDFVGDNLGFISPVAFWG